MNFLLLSFLLCVLCVCVCIVGLKLWQANETSKQAGERARERARERVKARAYFVWMYMTFGHTHILNCSPRKKIDIWLFHFAVRSVLLWGNFPQNFKSMKKKNSKQERFHVKKNCFVDSHTNTHRRGVKHDSPNKIKTKIRQKSKFPKEKILRIHKNDFI